MSAFLCIATLINSNLPRDHIILFLGGAETNVLRQYLWNAKVYTGLSSKNKKHLIEMIIYGFMCDKINNISLIEEIDKKILKNSNINIKRLLAYGNCDKRKKEFDQLKLSM